MIHPSNIEGIKRKCREKVNSCINKSVSKLDGDERFALALVSGCKICVVPGKTDIDYCLQAVNLIRFEKTENGFKVIEQIGSKDTIHIINYENRN